MEEDDVKEETYAILALQIRRFPAEVLEDNLSQQTPPM